MLGIQAWGKLLVSSMKFPKIEWWVDDGVINCRYQNIHKQSPKCTVRDEYNTWVWINMFQSYIVYRLDVDAEIQRGGLDGSQKSL